MTIRVELPAHLRTLAGVSGHEAKIELAGPPTISAVLDALEAAYPMLRGTIRDQVTQQRRAFLRFFACQMDLSHEPPDAPLPDAVASGAEPLIVLGAVAGGWTAPAGAESQEMCQGTAERQGNLRQFAVLAVVALLWAATCLAQTPASTLVDLDPPASSSGFPVAANGRAAAIYIAPENPETVRVAGEAFASDVERVTGTRPRILTSLAAPLPQDLILVGVLGQSPEIDRLRAAGKLDASGIDGKWESAVTTVVAALPFGILPGVRSALVIAGSDRRGAAFALFTLSRQMGVSPWTWWADVPVAHHTAIYVEPGAHLQHEPSVQYRGIFLNDEDWGLRPWAARKMDPEVDGGKGNIGPHTYERIFELLLRLHANSLWPAMHPGSLAFNAVPENARLAGKWGIVMGSSHSEALLRNNVGEWDEKRDGPWNYQTNHAAMDKYWDKRLAENGKYENFYTVGLRGVHDSGLEATGSPEVKARLVEEAMASQRALLARHIDGPLAKAPQIVWLYKESLDLYRVGMKVPGDVTLGWTDDNYGYLRELPTLAEQQRPGGSGIYYHVSYWGAPHDYLWLCTTPPALIREEMTKAYDHNARRYWVLNVGDLKPAEIDIDYFMQLAVDEPRMAQMSQRDFLQQWAAEQFPVANPGAPGSTDSSSTLGSRIADILTRYYALNFVRKPEFMGFNGYNDRINRTAFNPDAWSGPGQEGRYDRSQNSTRAEAWDHLSAAAAAIARSLPPEYAAAFFELVAYPVEGAAAMNQKFLSTDRTYQDAAAHLNTPLLEMDTPDARAAYDAIQTLTAQYNGLEGGKWDGIMSSAPRNRHVFEMPRTATLADADKPLPASWGGPAKLPAQPVGSGFVEVSSTVSINAAHFTSSHEVSRETHWNILPDLGISGASVVYGAPGLLANAAPSDAAMQDAPWLEYDFTTTSSGAATLNLHLLPTFAVDSAHRLRYGVSIDGRPAVELDASAPDVPARSASAGDGPSNSGWAQNVLRNSAIAALPIAGLGPGAHTLRLIYRDPGVVFEHLVLTFPGAPPAYPVPPETTASVVR